MSQNEYAVDQIEKAKCLLGLGLYSNAASAAQAALWADESISADVLTIMAQAYDAETRPRKKEIIRNILSRAEARLAGVKT